MDPNWPINRPFDARDLRTAIESTPVEATIVAQTEPSIDETAEMLELAAADPLIAGVVGWLDLRADAGHQLDELGTSRGVQFLVAARHQAESESESDPAWLSADPVVASVRALGRRGLAYDLLVKPHQIPAAIGLAEATRDTTRLVLDHCAKPPIGADLRDWARSVRELASMDHVACMLSGLVTEADWESWSLSIWLQSPRPCWSASARREPCLDRTGRYACWRLRMSRWQRPRRCSSPVSARTSGIRSSPARPASGMAWSRPCTGGSGCAAG